MINGDFIMSSLEDKLKARLASLKQNDLKNQNINYISNTSSDYIKKSLKQAGILNKKGQLINMVIT